MKPTQRHEVLALLAKAGRDGVCSLVFYRSGLPNARNRISLDLKPEGFHIESTVCQEEHEGTAYARYVLIHGPERRCMSCPPRPGEVIQQRLIAS